MTDVGAVARAVDLAFSELGGLNVVCNVAGIGQFYRTEILDPAVFDRIIAVNLRGTFLVCRFALPHLLEAGGGVIVNTTSVSGIVGNPWNAAYAASKGGVLMLTKALAAEYRHRGVRVNGVAPGMVATDLSAGFTDFFAQEDIDLSEFGRGQPVRAASPDEIAATFAFIASADAGVHVGRDRRARRRRHLLSVARSRSSSASDRSPTATTTHLAPAEPIELLLAAARAAEADAGGGLLDRVDAIELMPIGAWPYDDLAGLVVERLGLDAESRSAPSSTRSAARRRSARSTRPRRASPPVTRARRAARRCRGHAGDDPRAAGRCRAAVDAAGLARRPSRRWIRCCSAPVPSASAAPSHCFPLYEHALRAHEGATPRRRAGRVGRAVGGALRASPRPTRTRGRARRATRTTSPTVGPDNRMISFPYPKSLTANPFVNQGAALLVTDAETARAPRASRRTRWVHPLGGAGADEPTDPRARVAYHHVPGARRHGPRGAGGHRHHRRRVRRRRALQLLPGDAQAHPTRARPRRRLRRSR